MDSSDRGIGIAEAARRLGVGLGYAYGLIWSGKLPAEKRGGHWRVPMKAVEEYIKRRERDYASQ